MPPKVLVLVAMVAALAALLGGFLAYGGRGADLVGLQLAGSGSAARAIAGPSTIGPLRDAVAADYRLIAGYTAFLVLVLVIGRLCFAGPRARRAAGALASAGFVAGLLDVGENLAVSEGLDELVAGTVRDTWWLVAATTDTLKLVLLLPTAVAAVVTLLLVGRRTLPRRGATRCRVVPGSIVTGSPRAELPEDVAKERPVGRTGVCVSGGGIRSACVTLGALQVLRAHGGLADDGYLFSVSGGGYMTGALRLAMQPEGQGDKAIPLTPDAYAEGTPELVFLRSRGNYIAQGAIQWVKAFGIVLAHLLYALFLLAAVAVAAGLVLGLFYREYRIAGPWLASAWGEGPPARTVGATWLLGVLLVISVMLWLVAGAVEGRRGQPLRAWNVPAWTAAGLTVAVAVMTMLIPALVWLVDAKGPVATVTGSVGALSTLVTSFVAMSSKAPSSGTTGGTWSSVKQYAGPVVVVVVVALLVASMLLGMATTIVEVLSWDGREVPWVLVGLATSVLVAAVAAVLFDQTRASLHPFYRRRLNSTYSRRVNGVAKRYDYAEPTDLTSHDTKVPGYPEFVFVATAQVREPGESTRPVPYTFTSDWVGGAQVGYVRTEAMVNRAPQCYGGDLTLLGAVALSGAAFASAMGVMSKPYEVLLALSNARLGAWLPNPVWLGRDDPDSTDWTRRRLPGVRSEAYHVREVFGSHPVDDPLVLVTDGGHYDNLGLVEALRHRCETVVVIDSSNDTPPYATTLLDALDLAERELGVSVDRDDLKDLAPGSVVVHGDQPEPTKSLLPRFSRTDVVTGTIDYPAVSTDDARQGLLVVVKARLTMNLPDEVLAYAANNPDFPYDSTADQWFDQDQFDAYHRLGRHLGTVAVGTLERHVVGGGSGRMTAPRGPDGTRRGRNGE